MRLSKWMMALTISAGLSSLSYGQVTGTVKLTGKVPDVGVIDMSNSKECQDCQPDPVKNPIVVIGKDGVLKNVVISIKAEEGKDLGGEQKKDPVVIDQKGCMYDPHVIAAQVNQPILIKSDDKVLHNVQSLATENQPFNFAMQGKDRNGRPIDPQKQAETFPLKCNVHPWMVCWVRILSNPFFATTGADGTYSIDTKGLKDGEYTFVAWHERFGEIEQKAKVVGGKAELNFSVPSDE